MNKKLTINKYASIRKIYDGLSVTAGIPQNSRKIFIPEGNSGEKSIVKRLCSSLQNSGQMSNSIKFNKDRNNRCLIESVVCNYEASKFVKSFNSWVEVYCALTEEGKNDNGVEKGFNKGIAKSNWEKYAKGLFEGIHFLTDNDKNGFKRIRALIKKSNTVETVSKDMIDEISDISKHISGLGFALTCDWLKECGCTWLVKPDTHIVEVYKHLVGVDNVSNKDLIIDMFDYARLIRKELGDKSMTAYKLDKMIWLVCTGNFYQYDIQIGRDLIIKLVK